MDGQGRALESTRPLGSHEADAMPIDGRLAGGWQAVGGRWAGGARAAGRGGAHLKRRCLRELARDVHVSSATTTTKPASQAQKSELVRLPSCWWAVAGGTGVAGGRRTALACGLAHLGLGEHRQCLLKDVRRCERQGGWASTDCVGRCWRRLAARFGS